MESGEKCAGALDGRNKLFVMKSKSLIHLDDANHLERHLLIKTFTMFLAFSVTDHPFIRSTYYSSWIPDQSEPPTDSSVSSLPELCWWRSRHESFSFLTGLFTFALEYEGDVFFITCFGWQNRQKGIFTERSDALFSFRTFGNLIFIPDYFGKKVKRLLDWLPCFLINEGTLYQDKTTPM